MAGPPPHLKAGAASFLNFESVREEEARTLCPAQYLKLLEFSLISPLLILRTIRERQLLFSHFTDGATRDTKKACDLPTVTQLLKGLTGI